MSIEGRLSAPFRADEILFRVGATNREKTTGMCLYYMDARAVENRLDEVCGIDGWQNRYAFDGCCEIGIQFVRDKNVMGMEWLWKANGAGETDFEGEKGKYSDSFKRAATMWGIGRYLYGGPSRWYEIQARGKSFVFTDTAMAQIKKDYEGWIHGLHRFKPGEREEYVKQIRTAIKAGDHTGLRQLWDELSELAVMKLWKEFSSAERDAIKGLLADDAA